MPRELAALGARVGTQLTLVRLLTGMTAEMDDQVGAVGEHLVAEAATVLLHLSVTSSGRLSQLPVIDNDDLVLIVLIVVVRVTLCGTAHAVR